MKKRILILGLAIVIVLVCTYFGFKIFNNINSLNEQKIETTEYACLYETRSQDGEVNLGRYTYNIIVNKENNNVIKEKITAEKHYNTYDLFYEDYSRYNTSNEVEFKMLAYDFDTLLLVLQKEGEPNISYSKYIEMRPFDASSCKEKNEDNKVYDSKASDSDNKYLCKRNNNVFYFTVDKNGVITSAKSGSTHVLESIDEFEKRVSVLKDTEYVSYIYDIDNLTITQLNVVNFGDSIIFNDYVNNSLNGYECNLVE